MIHARTRGWVSIALLLAAGQAFAGAGSLSVTVTPLSSNVTYSSLGSANRLPLTTYIGYTVAIMNDGGNTINNIRFTGTTAVSDANESANFDSADGAACTQSSVNPAFVDCTIGQLKANQSYPTFAVFFKAPVKVSNSLSDDLGTDFVNYGGTTYYAEGTGGATSIPVNSTVLWSAASPVALGTSNPSAVKSVVRKSGGTLFTGDGGISNDPQNPLASTVTVPLATVYSTGQIIQSPTSPPSVVDPLCVNFVRCFRSDISIVVPATSAPVNFSPEYLTIVLRQDASNIKPGVKITGVTLTYYDESGVAHTIDKKGCAGYPSASVPGADNIPCIAKQPVYYKNRSVPGWTPELDGDFEWTLINFKNGGYSVD